MLEIIKDSYNITNKYIVLATPLIFFSLISSLYLLFSGNGSFIGIIIALFLFFLMLSAFLSGWFNMITKCIKDPKNQDPNSLIIDFPSGVGEYFIPTIIMLLIIFFIFCMFVTGAYFTCKNLIGNIGISSVELSKAMMSTEALKSFLYSLDSEQLAKLNIWNLVTLSFMSLNNFLIMFYTPALFFRNKNPLKALTISLKNLFSRKFLSNFALFVIIQFVYFVISIMSAVLSANIFIHFILTLLNFYFIVYIAVLIYNYYYKNYVVIGSNVDTTV